MPVVAAAAASKDAPGIGDSPAADKAVLADDCEVVLSNVEKDEVKRNVYNLVRRCKTEEFLAFSYLCMRCRYSCVGRKQLIRHLESEHDSVLKKSRDVCHKREDFTFLLSKLVMTAPFLKQPPTAKQQQLQMPITSQEAVGVSKPPSVTQNSSSCNEKTTVAAKRKPITFSSEDLVTIPKKKLHMKKVTCHKLSHEVRWKEQRIREDSVVSKLREGDLRKVLLVYLNILAKLDSLKSLSLSQISRKSGLQLDPVTLMDLLLLLYECAVGFYKNKDNTPVSENTAVKVGRVFMTSLQRRVIRDKGVRSVRCLPDGSLDTWLHPTSWRILLPPGKTLGQSWGRAEDSLLILAAFKHNLDIKEIVADDSLGFKDVAKDPEEEEEMSKEFKERFGYMLNLYSFRGKFNEEFGYLASNLQPTLALPDQSIEDIVIDEDEYEELIELLDDDDEPDEKPVESHKSDLNKKTTKDDKKNTQGVGDDAPSKDVTAAEEGSNSKNDKVTMPCEENGDKKEDVTEVPAEENEGDKKEDPTEKNEGNKKEDISDDVAEEKEENVDEEITEDTPEESEGDEKNDVVEDISEESKIDKLTEDIPEGREEDKKEQLGENIAKEKDDHDKIESTDSVNETEQSTETSPDSKLADERQPAIDNSAKEISDSAENQLGDMENNDKASESDVDSSNSKTAGSVSKRGGKGALSRGRGARKTVPKISDPDNESDSVKEDPELEKSAVSTPKRGRGRGRGRGKAK